MRQWYFCSALRKSCPLDGRGATGRYWGGLRHDFPLLLSGLLICVCGDHVCNGDLAWVLMMELASLML